MLLLLQSLEAARDHEMLDLEGTPQDIVDFRRKIVPKLILHACPECGEELDPRSSRNPDDKSNWSLICWECETIFESGLASVVDGILENGGRIKIDPDARPRNPVPPKPASQDFATINQLVQDELEKTGADADREAAASAAADQNTDSSKEEKKTDFAEDELEKAEAFKNKGNEFFKGK